MTSPISGPLHQAVDTIAGPAEGLATRLRHGSTRDLPFWSDVGGETRGADAVAKAAAAWWAPHDNVAISVLDGLGVDDDDALIELLLLADGEVVNLAHAVVAMVAEQDTAWRQLGDPTAAARGVELPDFPRPDGTGGHDAALRQQAVVRDFFERHDRIGGVLDAWDTHADPAVLLWHSAEGVRARGKEQLLAFYTAQHGRYAYSGVTWELHRIASRAGYTAGEITYTLTHDEHPTIVLPASFGVDFGADDKILAWRDYSRAWIPADPA